MPTLPPGLASSTSYMPSEPSPHLNNQSETELLNEMAKYGMAALTSLIKMEQSEYTNFALGQDMGKLGLDLSPGLQVLKKLALPWAETSRSEVEPQFTLPKPILQENIIPPPGPCDAKIQLFTDETLFYIFYMKPRDTLQEYAARELVARNWRYHKDIQVWLTKDSNVEPVLISQDVEKGVYIFFDPHNWEKIKKEFVLHYSSVQA